MVADQHKQIKGYRDLTQQEIAAMNEVKLMAEKVGEVIELLKNGDEAIDQRWVAIGATHLQQGFMALIRAIARPTTF